MDPEDRYTMTPPVQINGSRIQLVYCVVGAWRDGRYVSVQEFDPEIHAVQRRWQEHAL